MNEVKHLSTGCAEGPFSISLEYTVATPLIIVKNRHAYRLLIWCDAEIREIEAKSKI